MTDPVLAPDTYNYEREAITSYLRTNQNSPMTRQPMRVDQLIENRELRQEIQEIQGSTTSEPIECSGEVRSDGTLTQVSVSVPDGEAPSMNIVYLLDTSGSMCTQVTTARGETDGYHMLDIVCHGTNVCSNSLRPCDRAGVIAFNSNAQVVSPLQVMSPENKALMKVALDGLSPSGCTNIWDGIRKSLEMLPNNGIICLLTDGEPTVSPPKGELRMLLEWRDAHPKWCGQIHTYGFGYNLNSQLLVDISRAANGRYSFIPDSSMVGTVFVHSMANIRTTYMSDCVLKVETDGELTGISPHTKTTWGYQIPIGPLMYGQRRDYFMQCSSEKTCSIEGISLVEVDGGPNASDDRQRVALAIYESLHTPPNLQEFAATVTNPTLLEDINGQWAESMQVDYFKRWGRHYLPSLAAAHLTQTCNNFLDKGIQQYGGPRFQQLRDDFDKIFNEMPAPTASLRQQVMRSLPAGCTMRSAPVTMACYNDDDGPCFAGYCTVKTPTGKVKTLESLQKGDTILSQEGIATVKCVLKTMCPSGTAKLVQIGTLHVTPWHPIKPSNQWIFPSSIGHAEQVPCVALYSLLLDTESCIIEGMTCIGLGHGILNDDVASHEFFGTEKVVDMLCSLDVNDTGLVTLPSPKAIHHYSRFGNHSTHGTLQRCVGDGDNFQ